MTEERKYYKGRRKAYRKGEPRPKTRLKLDGTRKRKLGPRKGKKRKPIVKEVESTTPKVRIHTKVDTWPKDILDLKMIKADGRKAVSSQRLIILRKRYPEIFKDYLDAVIEKHDHQITMENTIMKSIMRHREGYSWRDINRSVSSIKLLTPIEKKLVRVVLGLYEADDFNEVMEYVKKTKLVQKKVKPISE